MTDNPYIEGEVLVLGDRKEVGFKNVRHKTGKVISGCTALASFYDRTGTIILASGSMVVTYDLLYTRIAGVYTLTSGVAGNILTDDGQYLGVYKITFPDGQIRQLEQVIVVLPNTLGSAVVDNPPVRKRLYSGVFDMPVDYRQRRTNLAQ